MINDNPGSRISGVLHRYYKSNNSYYNYRFTEFGKSEFDMKVNGERVSINPSAADEYSKQIISFAFALRASDANNCDTLNIKPPYCQLLFGSGPEDTGLINFYSFFFTEGFVKSVSCLSLEEQGIKKCDRPN